MLRHTCYPLLVLIIFLCSCQKNKDTDHFDNKIYIDATLKVNEILLKKGVAEIKQSIQASLAKPENKDVVFTYGVNKSLVAIYNEAYYDKAVMLPDENYELNQTNISITVGNVRSKKVTILFKNLENLDREIVYVLPVTIEKATIGILESARTLYYTVKGAALINVVGDIEENYLSINWTKPEVCNNLSQLTMEALIRVRNFNRLISTVMGIEGNFLIRIGDAGFPSNQIQIAVYGRNNFPGADENKGLPTNQWIHIALTYDSVTGAMIVYVNGKKQSEGVRSIGTVYLGQGGSNGFFIGRSWNDDRYLAGEISECRIWNVIRTPEEIAANPYYVDPDSKGLVAYWKFNEGEGNLVKDHTTNRNHAVANKTMKWTAVTLPAKEK